ncbi:hypothetical protein EJP75_15895 [Acinetobacter baumannii]|nr:hypothetical protein EJP75_15895 [Acinetobacter baumannii]
MGKIISLIGIILLSIGHANAKSKVEQCESILTGGVYNEFLENICGFNGGVSNSFKAVYSKHNCPDLVSTKKVHKLVADVSTDTKKRYVANGKELFCEKNLSSYSDLSEAFKQNIDIFNNSEFKQKN